MSREATIMKTFQTPSGVGHYLFYLFVDNTLCIYTNRYGETGTQILNLAYRISNEYANKISVSAFSSRSQYEVGLC